jgi:hypothetical protein
MSKYRPVTFNPAKDLNAMVAFVRFQSAIMAPDKTESYFLFPYFNDKLYICTFKLEITTNLLLFACLSKK